MDNSTLDACDRSAWITSYEMTMPFTVLQPAVMAMSIVVNSLLLVTICCSHRLKTSTHVCMASLACSDIAFSLYGTIYTAILMYGQRVCYSRAVSNILDRLMFMTSSIVMTSNYLHIILVSAEKWLYIAKPFLHQRIISSKVTMGGIIAIWVGSVFFNLDVLILPVQGYESVSEFKFSTIFSSVHLLACLILCVIYAHLAIIIRKQMRAINKTRVVDVSTRGQHKDKKENKRSQLTAKTTGTIRPHLTETTNKVGLKHIEIKDKIIQHNEEINTVRSQHIKTVDSIRHQHIGTTDTVRHQQKQIETDTLKPQQIETTKIIRPQQIEAADTIRPQQIETTDTIRPQQIETTGIIRPQQIETDTVRLQQIKATDSIRRQHNKKTNTVRCQQIETTDTIRPQQIETDTTTLQQIETLDKIRHKHIEKTQTTRPQPMETAHTKLRSLIGQVKSIRLLVLVFGTFLILLSPGVFFHFYRQYLSDGSDYDDVHKVLKLLTFSHGWVSFLVYTSQDLIFRAVLKTYLKKVCCGYACLVDVRCNFLRNRIHAKQTKR